VHDLPALILGITIATYWFCVGAMVVRVSRRRRARHVLIPTQRRERLMWVVWIPLVAAWIAMPFVARVQDPVSHPLIGLPDFARLIPAIRAVRIAALVAAIACLILSIQCWRHMGRHWRMGVEPATDSKLITDGPFRRVRHPIYTLSMILMVCSVLNVPTPIMLLLATVHLTLMHLKARNEEAFLLEVHGERYRSYLGKTGRFLPRFRPTC